MKNSKQKKQSNLIDLYKSGDLDSCLDLAIQLLQSDPDRIAPLQYAARVHSQRRETLQAKPYWERLTVLWPDLPEPFLQSARIARLEKEWDVCERYIDEFIRQRPDHAEALGIQIQCCLDSGDTTKIGLAFSRLCRLNPQAALPLAIRAVAHGMGEDVALSLCKFADDSDQTSRDMRARLAREARDAAIGCEIQKDPFLASNFYRSMQIYIPNSSFPATALNRLRKPFLKKAQTEYREKKYADAIRHAKSCIEIAPAEVEPYIIAGRSSAQLGLHQDAFDFLSKEVDRFWENSWLVLNYARAAMKVGKPDIAYAAYSAVKNRNDEKSNALKAECVKQLGRLSAKAAQDVQALLDKNEVILAYDKIFDFQKSGLKLNDLSALVSRLRDLGELKLRELAEFDDFEALDYAKKLVRLDPESEYANSVAGQLLLDNQKYAEAHYYWIMLTKLDGSRTEPLLNLARCYVNLNNRTEANKAASALLALDAHHAEGKSILELSSKTENLSRKMQS